VNEQNNPLASAWADHNRAWQDNLYVYPVISRRAGGISVGINLNRDKACTFDCPYCQVDRTIPGEKGLPDVDRIAAEIEALIAAYRDDGLTHFPSFANVPVKQRILRDLCLSGDGESTLSPVFPEVCALMRSLQDAHLDLDLKLVLITNATLLTQDRVRTGLAQLCSFNGEIWGKLDAGTEDWFQRVNISRYKLDAVEQNLIATVREFPMRIQTMLCSLRGEAPSTEELNAWAERVARIRAASPGHFKSVQLYSVVRSTARPDVGPLSITFLQQAAQLLERHSSGIDVGIYP